MLVMLTVGVGVPTPHAAGSRYQDEPDRLLADELSRRKVVMLGDFLHGGAYPYQSLLRVVEAWTSDRRSPRLLTLFLECESEAADILTGYLRSGDLEGLLDYYLPSGSHEQLEFYADLKDLVERSDEASSLWVRGAEPGIIYDMLDISEEESYRLFVEERDSTIAAGILDHIREFPGREVLVFYGNAHLIGNRVIMPFAPPGYPVDRREGYFLAHYLKSALGGDEVLTVNQLTRSPGQQGGRPDWPDDEDILVDWDEIPANWLAPAQLDDEYDVVIVRSQERIAPHPLRQLCCRRIVEEAVEDLERLAPFEPDGHFAVRYAGRDRQSLTQTTGETFSEPAEWRRWLSADDYDGMTRLMSPGFDDFVMSLIRKLDPKDSSAAIQLAGLGLRFPDIVPILRNGPEAWRAFWIEHRSEVYAMQAIGMMWCGDAEERAWADRYLVDLAGRGFETPSEAMKWWRACFRSVTY